jgi:ligand-binding SRPBCC domain-containing protein
MKTHVLESSIWLPRPIDQVFAFFSDAFNLEMLTPPFLNFHVLTPGPIAMRPGARIRYRLRLHGIPIGWESEITEWNPPHKFVDEQLSGPYRRWHHEHRFASRDSGTDVSDHVEYSVLGGALVNRFFVARDVRAIFAYRKQKLTAQFPPQGLAR